VKEALRQRGYFPELRLSKQLKEENKKLTECATDPSLGKQMLQDSLSAK
jgi:hypothetical protein